MPCVKNYIRVIKVLICLQLTAQDQDIDRWLDSLDRIPDDTVCARICYREGFRLRNSDPDLTLVLAETGLRRAKKAGSKYWQARHEMLKGIGFYKQGKHKESSDHLWLSIRLWNQLQDLNGLMHALINLGNIRESMAYFHGADSAYQQALLLAEELRDPGMRCRILINLAVLYAGSGQIKTARGLLHQAYPIALSLNNYELLSLICSNQSGLWILENRFDDARPWTEDALKYYTLTDNLLGMYDALFNLAQIEFHDHQIQKSDSLIQKISQFSAWMAHPANRSEWLKLAAACKMKTGDSARALRLLLRLTELNDSMSKNKEPASLFYDFQSPPYQKKENSSIRINFFLICITLILGIILSYYILNHQR